jgi:hypothetical protein
MRNQNFSATVICLFDNRIAAVIKPKTTHMLGIANESKEEATKPNAINPRIPPTPQNFTSRLGENHRYKAHPNIAITNAMKVAKPNIPVSAITLKIRFLGVINLLLPTSGTTRRSTSGIAASGRSGSFSSK